VNPESTARCGKVPHTPVPALRALAGAGVLAALFVIPRDVRATTLMYLTAEEHAESAAAVVIATLRRAESQLEPTAFGDEVFTYTTLDVSEVLKGAIRPDQPLVLKHPGGQAVAVSRRVDGAPELATGVEYLLFLAADPRPPYECYFVQSFELGAWRLERQGGQVWAVRSASEHAFHTPARGGVEASDRVQLDRVRSIAARSQGITVPQVPPTYLPSSAHFAPVPNARFTFLGQPSRWFEPDRGAPVVMYVNTTNFVFGGSLPGAVEWAMAQWSGVSQSSLRMELGGQTDACGFEPFDQVSSIAVDCRNEVPGRGCRSSGVIAIGGPRTYYDERVVVSGTEFRRIRSGDVVLNDPVPGSGDCHLFDDQRALNAVLTHEIGHVLGLGHSDAGETGDRPTMYTYIVPGMETLHDDDREAIRYVYPAPEAPPLAPELTSLTPEFVEQSADVTLLAEGRHIGSLEDTEVTVEPASGVACRLRSVTPIEGDRSRLELILFVGGDALTGPRSLVVRTPGGASNPRSFVVSHMVAPSDLRAVRERGMGRRRPVLLTWTDTSAVETSIRVERLNPRTGAFVPVAGGYLSRNTISFRDERARKKSSTYRVVFVNASSGTVSYSNAATVGAR
jgi:hypothetical protein